MRPDHLRDGILFHKRFNLPLTVYALLGSREEEALVTLAADRLYEHQVTHNGPHHSLMQTVSVLVSGEATPRRISIERLTQWASERPRLPPPPPPPPPPPVVPRAVEVQMLPPAPKTRPKGCCTHCGGNKRHTPKCPGRKTPLKRGASNVRGSRL